ncbi:MAG: cob(I)yrinic acid a,c-diamide adenosyltransferase [Anaerolineae bacterium]
MAQETPASGLSDPSPNRRASGNHGLVILYTGNGKGKTTGALGLVLRAWGHGLRPCVIQFIKDERGRWGETIAAERLDIPWHAMGAGFTFLSQDLEHDRACALAGWALAKEVIADGNYDLVVLDEFTYPVTYGWLPAGEVIDWLHEHRPVNLDLVITGREADPALVAYADLVTEMREVKHPYNRGVRARRGIEF